MYSKFLTFLIRRTFPLIKMNANGMEDQSLYTVQIEFRVSDPYKYRFINGAWRTSPRTEKISPKPIIYEHTDSPNFGSHWTKSSITFSKLKLTNNENTKNSDAVYLKSLMKYDPIVHVYRHDKQNVDDRVLVFSKLFQETQFIAVTAYQNENITSLKIKFNPFAKAFLNNNKPVITMENNKIIPEQRKEAKLEQYNDYQPAVNPTTQTEVKTESFLPENLLQNWYTTRYNINSYNQLQSDYQYNYGYNYAPYVNQNCLNNQYSYPVSIPQYQPAFNQYNQYYYPSYNTEAIESRSNKRSRSSIDSEDYIPYAKRSNASQDANQQAIYHQLPVSPNYSTNESYDESNTSSENYNIHVGTSNISSNSSYQQQSGKVTNESGYYSHSPSGIEAHIEHTD